MTSFLKSFRYALRGVRYVFVHERNFRVQSICAVFIFVLMFMVPISSLERVALILLVFMVLGLEILNSVIEQFIDILKPRLTYQVEVVKDMMAALVLLASVTATIVGALILLPVLVETLVHW